MKSRLSYDEITRVFRRALRHDSLIREDDTAIVFYDLSHLTERIENLFELFPESALHAIAAKANPLTGVLKHIRGLGVGIEVASLPELYLAQKAGFPADTIVFDSPAKTRSELEYALESGVHINADSLVELDRISDLLEHTRSECTIGLRINPQVGAGVISTTSVASDYSKFGVPIGAARNGIIQAFLSNDWLHGVHVHIGSQGCHIELLLEGIAVVLDLVDEVNNLLQREKPNRRIDTFDIGGGLPVSYHREEQPTSMSEYKDELARRFNRLFTDEFRLITEFGRYIHANAGWVATRVEYVKTDGGTNTLMVHVGADMFLRKCYNPGDWHHEISVVDRSGQPKPSGETKKYVVAGPLCFAGDIIAREIELPEVSEGDYLIIHDTGAYTLSMWSRYNSRQIPEVIGYRDDGKRFEVLKAREDIERIREFWR